MSQWTIFFYAGPVQWSSRYPLHLCLTLFCSLQGWPIRITTMVTLTLSFQLGSTNGKSWQEIWSWEESGVKIFIPPTPSFSSWLSDSHCSCLKDFCIDLLSLASRKDSYQLVQRAPWDYIYLCAWNQIYCKKFLK